MKYSLILIAFLSCAGVKAQSKNYPLQHAGFFNQNYPAKDTLKCMFLEVLNVDSAITKWTTGFVVRNYGGITFTQYSQFDQRTTVDEAYLPITAGIISNPLFYLNMDSVKNKAIKIILLPKNQSSSGSIKK